MVVCVTILTDVIQLGLFFGDNQDVFGGGETQEARTWQFSAGMMIISLMIKPLTVALACVAAYLMSGASLPRFGLGTILLLHYEKEKILSYISCRSEPRCI